MSDTTYLKTILRVMLSTEKDLVTVLNILSRYVGKFKRYETFPDTFLTALVY
jgi:hypothetical protein